MKNLKILLIIMGVSGLFVAAHAKESYAVNGKEAASFMNHLATSGSGGFQTNGYYLISEGALLGEEDGKSSCFIPSQLSPRGEIIDDYHCGKLISKLIQLLKFEPKDNNNFQLPISLIACATENVVSDNKEAFCVFQ